MTRGGRVERSSRAAPPSRRGERGTKKESTLLTVHIESMGDVTVVAFAGELDLGTIPRMEQPLSEQLAQRDAVMVDLREVIFIDSSGIGALIRAFRSAAGTPMSVLVDPGSQVHRIFDVAGVAEALPVFSDREAAMASLAPGDEIPADQRD